MKSITKQQNGTIKILRQLQPLACQFLPRYKNKEKNLMKFFILSK